MSLSPLTAVGVVSGLPPVTLAPQVKTSPLVVTAMELLGPAAAEAIPVLMAIGSFAG